MPPFRLETCTHEEHSSMGEKINLGIVLVATQSETPHDPAEDGMPSSRGESPTQALNNNGL